MVSRLTALGRFSAIIADSYAQYMAARTYLYHTARNMDLDQPGHRIDSDGVKLVATTMAKKRGGQRHAGLGRLRLF